MVALVFASLDAAQSGALAAIPLPRFAAPPGLGGDAWEPPRACAAASKLSEVRTPETQSPRSVDSLGDAESWPSAAQSPDPSPRWAALESSKTAKKDVTKASKPTDAKVSATVCNRRAAMEKRPFVAEPPGGEGDAAVEGPSLVQVFAELRAQQEDPYCILKLRKVHLLGARPMEALERHFGRVPGFKRLLVVYSHMKITNSRGEAAVRCKPSGLAFVLFASPGFARLALANGSVQRVDDVAVAVGRYEPEEAAAPLPQAKPSMEELALQIVEGARFAL